MFPRYRGKQVLMRDENGLEKCVACGLCKDDFVWDKGDLLVPATTAPASRVG